MAFNPMMSQAPSAFNPIAPVQDNSAAEAINAVASGVGAFAKIKSDADEATAKSEASAAAGGLFADTLEEEAQVLRGQEQLEKNQAAVDRLYQDGIISEAEQKDLSRLQKDRVRLEGVTNSRQRQVQLRMKYANFVNRYPHLTKEARIMFGDAETRMDEIAQGNQGLVDKEAFEEIYGKDGYNAQNISTFRNMQRFKAQREIGATYGEANFNDWSANFQADVSLEMMTVGQRMNSLIKQQGSLRLEDIDGFNSQIQTGYSDAVRRIDEQVAELQKNGQYVSSEEVQGLKDQLKSTRDDVMSMSEEKDFKTRMQYLNEAMEETLKYQQNVELGPIAKMFAGSGGGGAGGAADLATLKQILGDTASIQAAKSLPGPYGDQVLAIQQGAAKYITFLNNYDQEAAAQYISPAMARQLASIQGTRIDNGALTDSPEGGKTFIDLMDSGGTSDEVAEGIISRNKMMNQAAVKNNETKARLTSFANNYYLETEELLKSVGARVRKNGNSYEAFITNGQGKFVPFPKGTTKLNNLSNMYKDMPVVGDMNTLNSMIDGYKNTLNSEIQEIVATLNLGDMPEQMQTKALNRLQTMYSLTAEEMDKIRTQLRSEDGREALGG